MITCDFRKKKEESKVSATATATAPKTRKEIKKERICKRCGLEAKKLYNTKTISPWMREMAKIDWVTISIFWVIGSIIFLFTTLIILKC